jgi:transcriptional antiterminator RfaH
LRRQAFDTYLPLIRLPKRRRGKWEEVIEPLFPRYLFLHIDASVVSVAPIRSTRGVVGLVRFGEMPVPVPEAVIDFLRRTKTPGAACTNPSIRSSARTTG